MTDPLDLHALDAAERAATPGPWQTKRAGYPVDGEYDYCISTQINGQPYVVGEAFGRAALDVRPNAEQNSNLIAALRNAAPALLAAARRAQQDAAREGTHAPDCHLWGRRHYDCLLGKYEAAARERDALLEEVWALNEAAGYSREWGVRMDAETAIHRNRQLEEGLALQNAAAAILQPPEDLEGKDFYPWVEEQASRIKSDRAELARLREAFSRENEDISQVLGKVLGYPWFKDDRANFPDATEADGVCVGEHVAISLADEAAAEIARLRQALEAAGRRVRLLDAGESGLILGLYERMKKAEIAVDERDVELTRLRKRISELEGVSWSR